MNTKYRFTMNVGSASLVLIFTILCLMLFATLTLISAKNELNLTKKYAQSVTLYYAADSRAQEKMQYIEDIILSAGKISSNKAAFIQAQCKKNNFTYTRKDNKIYIIFNEDINAAQSLQVVVKVTSIKDKKYEIIQWKKINTDEINIDDSINVYK